MASSAVDENRTLITQVTVVYTDDLSESFEAVRVTDKGVIIGRFIENEQGEKEFLECGFIAHSMIREIIPNEKKE